MPRLPIVTIARLTMVEASRRKLLLDLAYVMARERFSSFIRTELLIIVKTPWIMLRGLGR